MEKKRQIKKIKSFLANQILLQERKAFRSFPFVSFIFFEKRFEYISNKKV